MGPESGIRTFDKIDTILLPIVLLLRVSLLFYRLIRFSTIVSYQLYGYFFDQGSLLGVHLEVIPTLRYLAYMLLHLAIFGLVKLQGIVQAMLSCHVILWRGICFWPRLYFTLFGPRANGRSVFAILIDPEDKKSTQRKLKNCTPAGTIRPLWARLLVFSTYQVYGAYAHLFQRNNCEVSEPLAQASGPAQPKVWDPLRLAIPYEYLASKVFEPPECQLRRGLMIALIVLVYLVPLSRGLTYLAYLRARMSFGWSLPSNGTSAKRRKRRHHVAFATSSPALRGSESVSFETDGIPFIVDNSATCIITNDRSLFPGKLVPVQVQVDTVASSTSRQRYQGTIRLELVDDGNVKHVYDIPGAIYDPASNFNLLGIPTLADFFNDRNSLPGDDVDCDGTTVKSSGCRSRLVWDHGQHMRTFTHGDSALPELLLYQGSGYFAAFCSRLRRQYDDNVAFAFSSAFSISPNHVEDPALVSDDEESEDEGDASHRNTGHAATQSVDSVEDLEWFTPPPPPSDLPPPFPSPRPPISPPSNSFELGMSLTFSDGAGKSETVVYEGVMPDGLTHTVRRQDGMRMNVHDAHLRLKLQADLSNIPRTPLDYCKEVGRGITKEEAELLARPQILSPVQQELMDWHHRLYHLSFSKIFRLAEAGHLPKGLLKCKKALPLCVACQFGTAHRRPWRRRGKASGSIRRPEHVLPGDGVSMDQIVSAQPGLIPQMSGFLTSKRIWGCTTFCDHVSDFVYVHLMRDFTVDETILAAKAFEKVLSQAARRVKHYHADNGAFAHKGFLDHVNRADQKITFCAVGAHHQNGIIENKNKMLTLSARTLLLHGIRMWPQMIDTMFWPFAFKAAAERHNCLSLNDSGVTPNAALHGIPQTDIPVKTFHTLFCPVYVLDARSQSAGGPGTPKWEPRSRIGVYLGHSPFHAGSVALVFNPRTGRVSPQYHVVFDDTFSTVPYMDAGTHPPHWEDLLRHSSEKATDEDFELAQDWMDITERLPGQSNDTAGSRITDPYAVMSDLAPAGGEPSNLTTAPTVSPSVPPSPSTIVNRVMQDTEGGNKRASLAPPSDSNAAASSILKRRRVTSNDNARAVSQNDFSSPADTDAHARTQLTMPQRVNLHEAGLRRSPRLKELEGKKKSNEKAHVTWASSVTKVVTLLSIFSFVSDTRVTLPSYNIAPDATLAEKMISRFHEVNELYDGTLNAVHTYAFSAITLDMSNNEVFTYTKAMQQPDATQFIEAMAKEIEDHESRHHWAIVRRSTIPPGHKTIQAIWSFKRKRYPDGTLNKYKARLCAHGGMQQWGVSYWETYSPVVNMLTVRLLLALCNIHGLESKSIDFILAFPQADLDVDIWMELPLGIEVAESPEQSRAYVLKLKKSLYGLKQASLNWFEKLKQGLIDRGFKPSEIDPCLYLKENMVLLTYVDDCIIISPSKENIDRLVRSMQQGPENFKLTDEGDVNKFLGVEITKLDDHSFELSQPFLIDRIVTFLGLCKNEFETDANSSSTPVAKGLLHRDLAGKPRKYSWKYRTAVGMLSYLQNSTRPEISMATHQTARFSNSPMLSHEKSIMRIGRYLLDTRKRGIIYKPDVSKGLECYVDADFAGGWSQADSENADNVLSRTGYVIMYADCPILWVSRLQTEIALSTAEAEYIALSQSLRDVIPLITLLKEINTVFPVHIKTPTFVCKVHEDNQSCITMATTHKFSPQTKHIALKYHHFRSYVKSGSIQISYCRTTEQKADILTKPLSDDLFFKLRYMLCGW